MHLLGCFEIQDPTFKLALGVIVDQVVAFLEKLVDKGANRQIGAKTQDLRMQIHAIRVPPLSKE